MRSVQVGWLDRAYKSLAGASASIMRMRARVTWGLRWKPWLAPGVLCFALAVSLPAPASPGLPLTEDFSTTTLRDGARTTANWSTEEQAVFLAWSQRRQLPSYSATGTAVGGESDTTLSVVLGDLDNDGDLDLIAGNQGQSIKRYLNDGDGGFSVNGTAVGGVTDNTFSVVLGDLDGDGDLDLIAGNAGKTNKLYLNNGNGGFSGTGTAVGIETDLTFSVVLGDLDGDGDQDLIAGNNGQTNKLYLNDGNGGFPAFGIAVGSEADSTVGVVLGDLDGDGDQDLIAVNQHQSVKRYLNDGNGGFPATGTAVGGETEKTLSVVLGDIDGDGDQDLIAGNQFRTNKLFLNDGNGSFPASGTAVGSEADDTRSVVLSDIDSDGDLDLIAGNQGTNKLYLNDGNGGFPVTGIAVGSEADNTRSVVLGDLDGDGDLDLIAGNLAQTNKLYLNDGGGFSSGTAVGIDLVGVNTVSVALGDLDGDGDLDLMAGNQNHTTKLYLNDGSGGFPVSGITVGNEASSTVSVVLGDLDSDGDLDLVAGNQNHTTKLYLNDGSGGFPASGTAVGSEVGSRSLALGDVDGDGDLDLIAGNQFQTNKLFLNNGNGGFPATGIAVGSETDVTTSLVLGDLDGDGDLDLIAGNNGQALKLYLNDGNGGFSASGTPVGTETDQVFSVVLGDLDGDGDLDLIAGGAPNKRYLNDGNGGFPVLGTAVGSSASNSVALGDIDDDGDLDLIAGNSGQTNKLYLNNGNGGFPATGADVGSESNLTNSVVLGDLDGDGDQDLIAGGQTNKLYFNDGGGGFPTNGTTVGSEADNTRSVVLGDIDTDGDLDLIAGNDAQTNKLYLNDGNGGFPATGAAVGSDADNTRSVVLGDLDGDGDLDLIAGNNGQTNKLYLNDGGGGFPTSGTTVGSEADNTRSLVLGDIDSDGDLDLLSGNDGQTNKLYLNNGNGAFAATGTAVGSETDSSRSVVLGDLDGDGDLDLIAGNHSQTNKRYLNNGNGGFAAAGTAVGSEIDETNSVVLGDVDGDGDLDLISGNAGQINKLYLNNGNGGFSEAGTAVGSESDTTLSMVLGDVDRDGDLDLIAGNQFQTNKLYQRFSYLSVGTVVSTTVNTGEVVGGVTLMGTASVNTPTTRNTRIDYFVSNNGGITWYRTYSGVDFIFPSTGTDVRWKAELHSLSPTLSPILSQLTLAIALQAQTISFNALPDWPLASGAFTVSANATSGLPVTFISLTSSTCSVAGATVTPISTGTCTVRASQVGDGNWLEATPVDRSFTIIQLAQTISFNALPNHPLASGAFTVSASASSGLPIAFSSLTPSTCSVADATVTPIATGTCSVRASQSGDSNWLAATPVDRSFTLLSAVDVALGSSNNPNPANTPLTLTATVTGLAPTGTVQFRNAGAPIAGCDSQALSGASNTRTALCTTALLPVGNFSLTAAYSGDGNNVAATSPVLAQTISAPLISLTSLPNAVIGESYSQSLSASGAGSVPPFNYAVTAGAPPVGLTFVNGALNGVPTTAATYNFTVTATDSSGAAVGGPFSGSRAYALSVGLLSTTTTIGTIDPEPSVVNQSYTVPVTVTSQVGIPGGLVFVSDGAGGNCTIAALNAGAGSCQLSSPTAGTKTITATYSAQGSFAASSGTAPHVVNDDDLAPDLRYDPATGSTINLTGTGTFLGDPATGLVAVTAIGGSGSGNVTLGCSVGSQTGGNFTLQSATSVLINPGDTPSPIAVRCTQTAAIQTGALSCTESRIPGSTQQRRWDLVCPAAAAVPPRLSYVPAPDPADNNTIVFPGGNSGAVVSATIEVTNTPAIGVGSTRLLCSVIGPQAGAFQVTGGNNQTVSATQGAVNLRLGCTLATSPRAATLSCLETDSPVVATRTHIWPLSCPAGPSAATGVVTVGRKVGVRGQRLVVPIGFVTDGQTYSVSTQVSFETARLRVMSVGGVAGAACFQLPAPNQNRIQMQRSLTTLPLPTDERYCDVTFEVDEDALGGVSPLVVVASTCTDVGGISQLCTEQDGQVAIAALDPTPGDGTTLVIAGHVGTLQQSQTLRVKNEGAGEREIRECTIAPATGLQITTPASFPVTLAQRATQMVTVTCTLPPLGQPRSAELNCTTTDPLRTRLRYPLTCTTYPENTPLPVQQLLDIEQREGEQMGTSVARSSTLGGAVVALGAPLGGSDGQGRVLLFEDVVGSGNLVSESAKRGSGRLRATASLELPSLDKGTPPSVSKQLGKSVALRADGGQLAVGAPFDGQGKVLLFDRPAGGWSAFDSRTATPVTLPAPTLEGGTTAEFGAALAYTAIGDLVAGAPGSSVGGVSRAGAAFVYLRNGGGFDPPASVTSSSLAVSNGRFGASLAVRNDQIVVGAAGELTAYPMPPPEPPLMVKTGAAYRIGIQGGALSPPIRITPTTALSFDDQFGSAMALTQNTLIIGMAGDDTTEGVDSGSAILFRPGASASGWNEASQLLPAIGSLGGQEMGASIAVNGDLIVVGAPKADVNMMEDRGRVYVYPVKASYAAQERPTSVLDNEGGRSRDEFGRALVINGSAAVIGVPKADLVLAEGNPIPDVGRGDAFLLERLFGNGFE